MIKGLENEEGFSEKSFHGGDRGDVSPRASPMTRYTERTLSGPSSTDWGRGTSERTKLHQVIGETPELAQGYFVYDSKKSGSTDRVPSAFGRAHPFDVPGDRANFVACHSVLLESSCAESRNPGDVLLNSTFRMSRCGRAARHIQQQIIDKKIKFYVMTVQVAQATAWARASIRSCRHASSQSRGSPPRAAIAAIKNSIKKSTKKGTNRPAELRRVDQTLRTS